MTRVFFEIVFSKSKITNMFLFYFEKFWKLLKSLKRFEKVWNQNTHEMIISIHFLVSNFSNCFKIVFIFQNCSYFLFSCCFRTCSRCPSIKYPKTYELTFRMFHFVDLHSPKYKSHIKCILGAMGKTAPPVWPQQVLECPTEGGEHAPPRGAVTLKLRLFGVFGSS